MIGIDKYAYNSNIARVKTSDKMFFAIIPLIICLIANDKVISIVTLIFMAFGTIILGGFSFKKYFTFLLVPSGFLIIAVLTIIVNRFDNNTAGELFYFKLFGNTFGITEKSLNTGLTLYLKALATVSCLYFISLNTPMNSIINFLKKIRIPMIIIELMELIYRFIFIIWEQAGRIHTAQNSRLGYLGFKRSLKSLGQLLSMVFIKSMNRVERIDIALESRGFNGNFEFLIEEEVSSKKIKCLSVLLILILIVIIVIERVIQ